MSQQQTLKSHHNIYHHCQLLKEVNPRDVGIMPCLFQRGVVWTGAPCGL